MQASTQEPPGTAQEQPPLAWGLPKDAGKISGGSVRAEEGVGEKPKPKPSMKGKIKTLSVRGTCQPPAGRP
jgi:hypothetical protein